MERKLLININQWNDRSKEFLGNFFSFGYGQDSELEGIIEGIAMCHMINESCTSHSTEADNDNIQNDPCECMLEVEEKSMPTIMLPASSNFLSLRKETWYGEWRHFL